MATRFRLPSSGSPSASPAIQSYSHTSNMLRRPLLTVDSSTLTTVAWAPDAADHLVAGDILFWQFVSSDTLSAGNIFSSTSSYKYAIQTLEANAGNNLQVQVFIGLVNSAGTSALATLRTKQLEGLEVGTALANRFFSGTLSTAGYTSVGGERLVIEFSLSGTPVAAGGVQGHNGSFRAGSDGAGGDLPENDTETGTTFNPWLEFATTLNFEAPASVTQFVAWIQDP